MSETKTETGTEVSSTPYLAPGAGYEMTEETYPPIGLRVFSVKGVGERPHASKDDLKADDPVAFALADNSDGKGTVDALTTSEALNTEVPKATTEAPKGTSPTPVVVEDEPAKAPAKKATTRKTTRKSAGSKAGTSKKES